ncbi:hypothetical protein GUJ93_ZPchr0001g29915 [Zizania palustris]|uniref:Uncharacterized protein n=1 Tax=Zizania palustris TaxID=103762 RepID=A0A8J5RPX8_ZIZPA|nr:hypothetical protein GUJ93_ZPchr0001g29915 [Zizania palustris]
MASSVQDAAANAVAAAVRATFIPDPEASDADVAAARAIVDAAALTAADAVRAALTPPAPSSSPGLQSPATATTTPAPPLSYLGSIESPPGVVGLLPDNLDNETVTALHAQAVAVLNIKSLVPATLDLATANYTKWRGLFLVTVGKYALTDHVLKDDYHPHRADWVRMDCVVLAWLYGSISAELLEIVMSSTATARTVWRSLEHQFLGNRERRALNLTSEFHNFAQGDLSVTDYCRRLKTMADSLGDLGEPVLDRTLVLTLLRGLNPKYQHLTTLLPMQRPFPSFVETRSQLLLEELTKNPRSTASATRLRRVQWWDSACSHPQQRPPSSWRRPRRRQQQLPQQPPTPWQSSRRTRLLRPAKLWRRTGPSGLAHSFQSMDRHHQYVAWPTFFWTRTSGPTAQYHSSGWPGCLRRAHHRLHLAQSSFAASIDSTCDHAVEHSATSLHQLLIQPHHGPLRSSGINTTSPTPSTPRRYNNQCLMNGTWTPEPPPI